MEEFYFCYCSAHVTPLILTHRFLGILTEMVIGYQLKLLELTTKRTENALFRIITYL